MSAVHTSAVLGRRTCALLAACSASLHVAMLGHAANPVIGGLLVAMVAGCLFCARHLWQRGTPGIWCTVALMNLAMIALHTPMPAHHHHGLVAPAQTSTVMTTATLLALVEVVIAAAVLAFCTRRRSVISPRVG